MLVTSLSTLLCIDNNVENRRQLASELVARDDFDGCILEASTPREGANLCEAGSVDCVLLNLDVLDALAVAENNEIVQLAQRHQLWIVLRISADQQLLAISSLSPNLSGVAPIMSDSAVSMARLVRLIGRSINSSIDRSCVADSDEADPSIECAQLQQEIKNLKSSGHKVSHDLKNPLFAAREFVSLILDEVSGPLTQTQREYLDIALDSCDQVSLLMDEWLTAFAHDAPPIHSTSGEKQ